MQKGGSLGQGLLSPIQTVETRKAHPGDPESSTARLGPRGFSAEVVDSLGEGFVFIHKETKKLSFFQVLYVYKLYLLVSK